MSNRKTRRRVQKKHIKSLNKYSDNLEPISLEDYNNQSSEKLPNNLIKAYVSKKYLVQLYQEKNKPLRISISRNTIDVAMKWHDGITWDEIQSIKNEIGFEDHDCVEVYPAQKNIVDVANMRHIWVMDELLLFSWKN